MTSLQSLQQSSKGAAAFGEEVVKVLAVYGITGEYAAKAQQAHQDFPVYHS